MHIMEGVLPVEWCLSWLLVLLSFVAYGMIKKRWDTLSLLAVDETFIFILPSLKMPALTGSGSLFTGTGLETIIFGPDAKSKTRISVYHFGGDRS